MSKELSVDVGVCPRCYGDHPGLVFRPLANGSESWKRWAMCPAMGQPIVLNSTYRTAAQLEAERRAQCEQQEKEEEKRKALYEATLDQRANDLAKEAKLDLGATTRSADCVLLRALAKLDFTAEQIRVISKALEHRQGHCYCDECYEWGRNDDYQEDRY